MDGHTCCSAELGDGDTVAFGNTVITAPACLPDGSNHLCHWADALPLRRRAPFSAGPPAAPLPHDTLRIFGLDEPWFLLPHANS